MSSPPKTTHPRPNASLAPTSLSPATSGNQGNAPSREKTATEKIASAYYQPNADSLNHFNNVGHLIKDVYASIVKMMDQGVAPLGLTAIQWRPLVILRYGDIDTPAEIARRVNVDTGAMTRTLDRLEAKGFLTRRRSQEDRRVVKLELTDSGHDVVNNIMPAVADTLNTHLSDFSKAEIHQLLSFLHRLIANGSPGNTPAVKENEP